MLVDVAGTEVVAGVGAWALLGVWLSSLHGVWRECGDSYIGARAAASGTPVRKGRRAGRQVFALPIFPLYLLPLSFHII